MNKILRQRELIKKVSEGYKAEGIIRYELHEVCLVEICGGAFGSESKAKVQFDRQKGLYGALAMLQTLATDHKNASVTTFEKLHAHFIHTKANTCQLWSIQFINRAFIFRRIHKSELSLDFHCKSQTIIDIMYFAQLVESVNAIDSLSKENEYIIQKIALGLIRGDDQPNLANIVKPTLHKLSEQSDATGLYNEDPVSFITYAM